MLDAAHGETVGPARSVERVHVACIEVQVCRVDTASSIGRRRPIVAARADIRQGSRLTQADARGRREKNNRWDE